MAIEEKRRSIWLDGETDPFRPFRVLQFTRPAFKASIKDSPCQKQLKSHFDPTTFCCLFDRLPSPWHRVTNRWWLSALFCCAPVAAPNRPSYHG